MKIAIVAFTKVGQDLSRKISDDTFDITLYDKQNEQVKDWLKREFYSADAIIFIGAVGIATRLISTLLVSKDKDPAVIVIDEKASFVIPILSGHIGGANKLAISLAKKLGATPVITTSTDVHGAFAVDVWAYEHHCVIDDISLIKQVSASILEGIPVGFYSDFSYADNPLDFLSMNSCKLPSGLVKASTGNIGICVSLNPLLKPFKVTLNVVPQITTIGVGCKKDTDSQLFEQFVLDTLAHHNISFKAVKSITSIDLKQNEPCVIEFAKKYDINFTTYSAEQLTAVSGEFSGSDFVKKTTGVDNVCERSAVAKGGKLLVKKTTQNGMTIAIAIENQLL